MNLLDNAADELSIQMSNSLHRTGSDVSAAVASFLSVQFFVSKLVVLV
jgi:hypothetical protein